MFRNLYDKLRHLKGRVFFTGGQKAFSDALPPERHIAGKEHTVAVERDNTCTHHHLARFTRCTKVVSQLEHMVGATLRIWRTVTVAGLFLPIQKAMLDAF